MGKAHKLNSNEKAKEMIHRESEWGAFARSRELKAVYHLGTRKCSEDLQLAWGSTAVRCDKPMGK